ncbi:MAG: hypothetical protein QW092_03495 [Candidatus Korarchaeum sp.]
MTFYATPLERKLLLKYLLIIAEIIRSRFPEECSLSFEDLEMLLGEEIKFSKATDYEEYLENIRKYETYLNNFIGLSNASDSIRGIVNRFTPTGNIIAVEKLPTCRLRVNEGVEVEIGIDFIPKIAKEKVIHEINAKYLISFLLERALQLILNDFRREGLDDDSTILADSLIRVCEVISDIAVKVSLDLPCEPSKLHEIGTPRTKLYDLLSTLSSTSTGDIIKFLEFFKQSGEKIPVLSTIDEGTYKGVRVYPFEDATFGESSNVLKEKFKDMRCLSDFLIWYPEKGVYECPACHSIKLERTHEIPYCGKNHGKTKMKLKYCFLLDENLINTFKRSSNGFLLELFVTCMLRRFLYNKNINATLANRVKVDADEFDIICLVRTDECYRVLVFEVKFNYKYGDIEKMNEKLGRLSQKLKNIPGLEESIFKIHAIYVFFDKRGSANHGNKSLEDLRIVPIDELEDVLAEILRDALWGINSRYQVSSIRPN